MRLPRLASLAALGTAVLAVSATGSRGETPADVVAILKPHAKTQELGPLTSMRVQGLAKATFRVLKTPDEKKNLEALDELARYFAYKVTQEKYYNPGSETGELKARPTEDNFDAVFAELRGYLLKPTADNVSKMTVDNADYIKEFGAALDRALVPLVKLADPRAALIRVNAARMLAVAAESGAPAFGKTITALLNDPKTPPEVLLHTYQAAEAYLSAYDPYAVGRVDATRHNGDPADVIALIQALERHIVFDKGMPAGPVADKVVEAQPLPAPPAPVGATPRLDQEARLPRARAAWKRRVSPPNRNVSYDSSASTR